VSTIVHSNYYYIVLLRLLCKTTRCQCNCASRCCKSVCDDDRKTRAVSQSVCGACTGGGAKSPRSYWSDAVVRVGWWRSRVPGNSVAPISCGLFPAASATPAWLQPVFMMLSHTNTPSLCQSQWTDFLMLGCFFSE